MGVGGGDIVPVVADVVGDSRQEQVEGRSASPL